MDFYHLFLICAGYWLVCAALICLAKSILS
jgi:hypothetical protein